MLQVPSCAILPHRRAPPPLHSATCSSGRRGSAFLCSSRALPPRRPALLGPFLGPRAHLAADIPTSLPHSRDFIIPILILFCLFAMLSQVSVKTYTCILLSIEFYAFRNIHSYPLVLHVSFYSLFSPLPFSPEYQCSSYLM